MAFTADMAAPSESWRAVTPHNSTNLMPGCRAIYVGGDGDVVAVDRYDNAVTFVGVLAGSILPIQAKRINATNTTATNLVALY